MESTLTYQVTGMRCAGCAGTLESKAGEFPEVARARVNFPGRLLQLETRGEHFGEADFLEAMGRLGYGLTPPRRGGAGEEPAPLGLMGLLVLLGLPVLLQEHGVAVLPAPHVAVPLLATLVQVLGGAEFYRGARAALRAGGGNMDVLVSVGISAAYGYSLLTLLAPGLAPGPALFEGSVMLILFIRFGRTLEERMRTRATTALDRLATREVGKAVLLRDDGSEREVPADGLRPGDRALVRAGERIPADGVVEEGESEAEEAFLTGEPLPRPKAVGDRVFASSLNGSGRLVVRVERVGADSLYEKVVALAQDALMEKPPVQRFADRVAAVFVPAVLALSALTLTAWLLVTGDPGRALTAATAVVVVACPCALGLATPTAVMVASGVAADLGFLFRSGAALETMAAIDRIAFDKTGTLTRGEFELRESRLAPGEAASGDELLHLARRLEAGSNHPLARAFRPPEGEAVEPLVGLREVPGRGVEAGELRLGSERWMRELGISETELAELSPPEGEGTPLFLVEGERLRAAFWLDDALREESPEVLGELRRAGLRPVLLSGDRRERVEALAGHLGIEGRGELLPEEKLAWIEQRQAEGERVAFVGDGVNDAPALARADLGVALGEGSARARESGDLVLLSGSLESLGAAFLLARRTMAVIRQNLAWALVYNLLGLPLAAGVLYPWTGKLLPPHYAGLAMALSSVCVVGNSLRLARPREPEGDMSQAMDVKKAKVAAFIDSILERLPAESAYPRHYLGWFECFDTLHYYEAHDVLEALWHDGGREHENFAFYKGLIQVAGAFVHMKLHREQPEHRVHGKRLDPACRLFDLAIENLSGYGEAHQGLDVTATVAMCRRYRDVIRGSGDRENPWTEANAPRFGFPGGEELIRPVGGI